MGATVPKFPAGKGAGACEYCGRLCSQSHSCASCGAPRGAPNVATQSAVTTAHDSRHQLVWTPEGNYTDTEQR